jgi:hypothetical protein
MSADGVRAEARCAEQMFSSITNRAGGQTIPAPIIGRQKQKKPDRSSRTFRATQPCQTNVIGGSAKNRV